MPDWLISIIVAAIGVFFVVEGYRLYSGGAGRETMHLKDSEIDALKSQNALQQTQLDQQAARIEDLSGELRMMRDFVGAVKEVRELRKDIDRQFNDLGRRIEGIAT